MKSIIMSVCLINLSYSFCAEKGTILEAPKYMVALTGYLAKNSAVQKQIGSCELAIHQRISNYLVPQSTIYHRGIQIKQLAFGGEIRVACQDKDLICWLKDKEENSVQYSVNKKIEALAVAPDDKTIGAIINELTYTGYRVEQNRQLFIFDVLKNEAKVDIKLKSIVKLDDSNSFDRGFATLSLTNTHAVIGNSVDTSECEVKYIFLNSELNLDSEQKVFLEKEYSKYLNREDNAGMFIIGLQKISPQYEIYHKLPKQIQNWLRSVGIVFEIV